MMTIDDYKSLTDPTYVKPVNFYVVAGNYNEYLEYVKKNALDHPEDKRRLLFVLDQRTFRGTENPQGVFIGTWRKRLDIEHVLHAVYVAMRDKEKSRKIRNLFREIGHAD